MNNDKAIAIIQVALASAKQSYEKETDVNWRNFHYGAIMALETVLMSLGEMSSDEMTKAK